MTLNEKIKQIEALSKKMEGFMKTTMPRLAGRLAINHFESNFIKGGWQDGSLTAWKMTVRQTAGGGNAERRFKPVPSTPTAPFTPTRTASPTLATGTSCSISRCLRPTSAAIRLKPAPRGTCSAKRSNTCMKTRTNSLPSPAN
jgi:hypothetical protein